MGSSGRLATKGLRFGAFASPKSGSLLSGMRRARPRLAEELASQAPHVLDGVGYLSSRRSESATSSCWRQKTRPSCRGFDFSSECLTCVQIKSLLANVLSRVKSLALYVKMLFYWFVCGSALHWPLCKLSLLFLKSKFQNERSLEFPVA